MNSEVLSFFKFKDLCYCQAEALSFEQGGYYVREWGRGEEEVIGRCKGKGGEKDNWCNVQRSNDKFQHESPNFHHMRPWGYGTWQKLQTFSVEMRMTNRNIRTRFAFAYFLSVFLSTPFKISLRLFFYLCLLLLSFVLACGVTRRDRVGNEGMTRRCKSKGNGLWHGCIKVR